MVKAHGCIKVGDHVAPACNCLDMIISTDVAAQQNPIQLDYQRPSWHQLEELKQGTFAGRCVFFYFSFYFTVKFFIFFGSKIDMCCFDHLTTKKRNILFWCTIVQNMLAMRFSPFSWPDQMVLFRFSTGLIPTALNRYSAKIGIGEWRINIQVFHTLKSYCWPHWNEILARSFNSGPCLN